MQLPKYTYYIGKLYSPVFTQNYRYNVETGEVVQDSGCYAMRTPMEIQDSEPYIFLNMRSTQYRGSYILYFDEDGSYMSYSILWSLVNTGYEKVLTPPSGAKYFALSIDDSDAAGQAAVGSDLLYMMKTFTPVYKELKKKLKKEDNQMFFRAELDGDVDLLGRDCEYVYNSSIESKFIFVITKYSSSTGEYNTYFKGTFAKTDCKFDYMKKTCTPDIDVLDEYNAVMDNYDNTYDLLKLKPANTKITMWSKSVLQVYIAGSGSITSYYGGTYYEADVSEQVDDYDELTGTYYFAYQSTANEIQVRGSTIGSINGYYAGIISSSSSYLYNNDSSYRASVRFTRYADEGETEEEAGYGYYLVIARVSDGTEVYRSRNVIEIGTLPPSGGYVFAAEAKNVAMVAVAGNGIVADTATCTVDYIFTYHIYQRLLTNLTSIRDSEGTKTTYDIPSDDFVSSDTTYKKCIGFVGNLFFCTVRTTTEATRWGQNDDGNYFTNDFIPSSTGLGRPLPLSRSSWVNASLWFVYSTAYELWEPYLRSSYTLKDAYSIAAVIKALLSKVDPTLLHEATSEYSEFLYADTSPINLTRFYVFITPKSNILAGNYDQAAQTAETTLEDVMNMLQKCFKCYFFIEDGKFRIEHIRYFMNGRSYTSDAEVQLDFTGLTDQFNKKPVAYYQSEIEYNKDDLASRFEFDWADDVSDLFGQFSIDVKSYYVQQDDTESVSETNFTPDVDLMLLDPSSFSDDGFALLCPVMSGSTYELPVVNVDYLEDEDGNSYSGYAQNFYASWLYLARCYMYDMPAATIECSSVREDTYTVRAVKKCMEHTVQFQLEDDPDEWKLVKTALGNGTIDEMTINLNTRMVEADLVYTPS